MASDQQIISLSELRGLLDTIRETCTRFQILSLQRQITVCQNLLAENPPIDVAILGQFKAGKSSFINSLIGKNILPIGVIPVTTSITRLQYGEKDRAVVTHFDGKRTEIDLDSLEEYTSEARNPANEKNVAVVDIELPSLREYQGLRLVDTPGLGSVFHYHKATSENWLPEVGAAILAISADRPLSDNDLQLIRELTTHSPRVILLLTKVDLLTPEQRTEVVHFFEKTLSRELNREFPIYMYSTRTDEQQWKEPLEKEVLLRLSANRDFEFRRILKHKSRTLKEGCLAYLEIALKTSLQADQDRDALRRQILDERVNYDIVREEMFIITRENQKQTLPMLVNYLLQFLVPLTGRLRANLTQDMAGWQGNLWKLTRNYEEWLSETMTAEIRAISKAEHKRFYGTLKKAHASLSRSLDMFRRSLNDNIQRVLGVNLGEMDWQIDVVEPDHPDIRSPRVFDYHFDLIWFLIPMLIFRKLFENNFTGKIRWEVEVNLSRLGAQWADRINGAIEAMKKQAMRYVIDEITTIEALLSKTHGQTEEIQKIREKLLEASGLF